MLICPVRVEFNAKRDVVVLRKKRLHFKVPKHLTYTVLYSGGT